MEHGGVQEVNMEVPMEGAEPIKIGDFIMFKNRLMFTVECNGYAHEISLSPKGRTIGTQTSKVKKPRKGKK